MKAKPLGTLNILIPRLNKSIFIAQDLKPTTIKPQAIESGVMADSNPNSLNGVPEIVIPRLLSRQPIDGYQLVRTTQEQSQGQFTFGEGCIQPIPHYLE